MPNRLSSAKREQKEDEKVRQAEEKYKELAAAKQRKIEKKAQRLAERKSIVCEFDDTQEIVLLAADEVQVCVQQDTEIIEDPSRNACTESVPIDVLVQCMTGEEFWLTPLPETAVADLKDMLAGVWGIPSVCQQLLVNCTVLRDSDLLCHHMQTHDNVINCTGVVVLGEVREPSVLAKLALRGSEGVLNAVFHAMGSEDDGTRYQIFIEVRRSAKQGDARAIAVLIKIMNNALLPSLCVEILNCLAAIGTDCDDAKSAIISQLQHPEACVRVAALHGFIHFPAIPSQRSISAVFECLEDELEDVRFQAVQVLTDIAAKCHADVIVLELKKRLGHVSGGVRRAAVQAISRIGAQGSDKSVCAGIFVPLLADPDPDVRAAAVQSIDCNVAPNSQQAFQALVAVLFDHDWCVRQLALHALKQIAWKDVDFLIRSAKPYLRHQDAMIRCTAVEALGTAKEWLLNADVISDLKHLLSDDSVLVRSVVVRVLTDFPQ